MNRYQRSVRYAETVAVSRIPAGCALVVQLDGRVKCPREGEILDMVDESGFEIVARPAPEARLVVILQPTPKPPRLMWRS